MGLTDDQREKWCAALRSGDYKQGKYKLFDGEKYCCLGVFYEVVLEGSWEYTDSCGWLADAKDITGLGGRSSNIYGLSSIAIKHLEALPVLNDVRELSFNEIADYIEEHKV